MRRQIVSTKMNYFIYTSHQCIIISNYSPAAVIFIVRTIYEVFNFVIFLYLVEFYRAEIKISLPYLATLLLINHLKCHFSFEYKIIIIKKTVTSHQSIQGFHEKGQKMCYFYPFSKTL